MTIRRRLTLGFLTILALFALNEGIQFWSARLRASTMEALSGALKRQVLMASVHQQVGNLQGLMTQLSQLEDPVPLREDEYTPDIERAGTNIHELVGLSDEREHSAFSELEQTYVKLSAAWRVFFANLGVDDAKYVGAQLQAEPLGRQVLQQILPRMQAQQDQSVTLARQTFDDVTRRTDQVSFAIFTLSMLVSVAIAYLIGSYLTTNLRELQTGAGLIGAMNLEHRIRMRSSDEIGTVAAAFNQMGANHSACAGKLTAVTASSRRETSEIERERQVSQFCC